MRDSEPAPADALDTSRWSRWLSLGVVATCTLLIVWVLHPRLLFTDTLAAGRDLAPHNWGPAFLRGLLAKGQLSGWTMDYAGGFPAYRFYMILPALVILALDLVMPYNVAMRVVAMSGVIALPVCAWAMGRLMRLRRPFPELLAIGATMYAFNESYSLLGANLLSTLVGEFSYALATCMMLITFGLVSRMLTEQRSWRPVAMLLGLLGLTHIIVFGISLIGAAVLVGTNLLLDRSDARAKVIRTLKAFTTAATIPAVSLVPLALSGKYVTDPKYVSAPSRPRLEQTGDTVRYFPGQSIRSVLLPYGTTTLIVGAVFALGAVVFAVRRRHALALWLAGSSVAASGALLVLRHRIPFVGKIFNLRLLPFVLLTQYLLVFVGISVVVGALVRWVGTVTGRGVRIATVVAPVVVGLVAMGSILGVRYQVFPGQYVERSATEFAYKLGPLTFSSARGTVSRHAEIVLRGFENDPEYPELRSMLKQFEATGTDPRYGCGTVLIENEASPTGSDVWLYGRYGSGFEMSLLPFFTDGCMRSAETVFTEAAGALPYFDLARRAMSVNPSNAVAELRTEAHDPAVGVRYMKALGIRYFLASTEGGAAKAATQSELQKLFSVGPWTLFALPEVSVVEGLDTVPVVARPYTSDSHEGFLELGTSWLQHPEDWVAMPAENGPETWQRVEATINADRGVNVPGASIRRTNAVMPAQKIDVKRVQPAVVSNVAITQDTVSFDVDQVGVPVLVKVAYFPNWSTSGADGPWRVGTNMMVVIPTAKHVELRYRAWEAKEVGGLLITLVGFGILGYPQVRRRRDRAS